MNNNQVSCSGCGKVYQALSEITAAGGRVYSLGLALKARCICGNGLGGVNHLWKWVETREVSAYVSETRQNEH